jgi:hypothetical protein
MKHSKRTPKVFLAKNLASEALSWAANAASQVSPIASAKQAHVSAADANGVTPIRYIVASSAISLSR